MNNKINNINQLSEKFKLTPPVSVSVIIPTHNRPSLLPRAVKSALSGLAEGQIEVIIVPNGKDNSWHESLREWKENPNVRIYPSIPANVSIARNLGLSHARGTVVRFLDDDDFLIPEVAAKQYLELINSELDLSTYSGRIEDSEGRIHQIINYKTEEDYGCAVLSHQCPAITFATVYKRNLIQNRVYWNSQKSSAEDEEWMREILNLTDPHWKSSEDIVGVWVQHSKARLSFPIPKNVWYKNKAESIIKTISTLESEGRFTAQRKKSAAQGIWFCVHGGFYFAPTYWTKIAKIALKHAELSHPEYSIFKITNRLISPIIIEWLMTPKRVTNHLFRIIKGRIFGWNKIRKI